LLWTVYVLLELAWGFEIVPQCTLLLFTSIFCRYICGQPQELQIPYW
jgi:hypothetical protein